MALAMAQPKKESQHFQAFRNNHNNKDAVISSSSSSSSSTSARANFKFNADAPVFVPRSQSLPASATSFFYPYFPSYPNGNDCGGGGGGMDWIYVSDQDALSSTNTSNPNSSPASPKEQQSKNVLLTEDVQKKILKQMEYQFSDMSLLANDNIAKQISKDLEGYVPIYAVASTKKIKSLVGTNHQLIAQALQASTKLDVSSDGKRVKRKIPFSDKVKDDLQLRTIVAENLPDDHSHQNIEKIFNVAGSVKTIRICHPQDPSTRAKGEFIISTKLHALVEFETPESAEKAVELLNDQRDWRKGLRVRCLLRRSPKSVLKSRKSDFDSYLYDEDDGLPAEIFEVPTHIQPQPANIETVAVNNSEENSATPKKIWNKGRGKGRQQRTQMTAVGLGRGLLASAPLFSSSSILGDAASPRLVVKGPRMPDGTRGFTMGRGGPLGAPPISRACLASV